MPLQLASAYNQTCLLLRSYIAVHAHSNTCCDSWHLFQCYGHCSNIYRRRTARRATPQESASESTHSAAVDNFDPASSSDLPFFPDRRLVNEEPLPSVLDCMHFINLTNGIEAVPQLQHLGIPFSFVRIQSTSCEQQLFEKMLAELDSTLLLYAALGHCCLIYDCGSRNKKRGAPRALWYGLEFIRYALTRMWFPEAPPPPAFLRGYSVQATFEEHVRGFSKSTKKRLRYFGKYIPAGGLPQGVRLYGVYRPTLKDDDFPFHRNTLQAALPAPPATADAQRAQQGWEEIRPGAGEGGGAAEGLAQEEMGGGGASPGVAGSSDVDALLAGDPHQAVERLLGMRLFLGGVPQSAFQTWSRAQQGEGG